MQFTIGVLGKVLEISLYLENPALTNRFGTNIRTILTIRIQGRSQVFIGGGQAGGNDKFVNKTLQQNIESENFLL